MTTRILPCLAAIAAAGTFSVPAQAGFYSGDALYEVCTVERGDAAYFEKTYECAAYIAGAVDAFNTTREANKLKSCIPAGVTISNLKDATVDFMRANPAGRNKSASALVFSATRKAWPCRKKK
ncbi:Rap1a/Tai family immunity protein [Sphingobium sp. H39-3-25]|uniref:Rap1a/Tai family immunity protein n=1 Tax=Sphingobium arseniciresistens TaxID=3030834 RepID=UPI0023B91885|nr:Rap1a/Tai family immunity protein [Sphingobium arseniciresistens]